jgi:hypothetical protein
MLASLSRHAIALLALALVPAAVQAENATSVGDYVVHHNAFTTSTLRPEVARAYDVPRSKNRGMVVITVLKRVMGTTAEPVAATIRGDAYNLSRQNRGVQFREVNEGNAIYYLATFRVDNEETLDFNLEVQPQGRDRPIHVEFRQQFFTD